MVEDQRILKLLHFYRRVNHAAQVEVAIQRRDVKFLHHLLEEKNVLEQRHMSMAVKLRALHVIKYLFRRGLKIDLPGEFYLATAAGSANGLEVVRTLVELGADVNVKDDKGCCPLSRCVRSVTQWKLFTMANLLMDNGADLNSVDNFGQTPLIHCAKSRHLPLLHEVMKMLFRRGADERVKDSDGLSIKRILLGRGCFRSSNEMLVIDGRSVPNRGGPHYREAVPMLNRVHIWRNKKCFSQVCTTFYCASKSPASTSTETSTGTSTETSTETFTGNSTIKKPKTSSNVSFLEVEVDILHIIFSFLRAD